MLHGLTLDIEKLSLLKTTICNLIYYDGFLGGSTLFKGFAERLKAELFLLANNKQKSSIKINANENRLHAAWTGASILSSLSTFSSTWITREEYDEFGTDILRMKCF